MAGDAETAMTTVLLATGTVHEAAALCDYLADRLNSGDLIHTVGVSPEQAGPGDTDQPPGSLSTQPPRGDPSRDRADALNAVRSRLGAVATVKTEETDADAPVSVLLDRAQSIDADEYVLADTSLARELLSRADRPVVVLSA
jgi:hypothetical protein